MALLPGSPAIDAGGNALAVDAEGNTLITDQRGPGYPRITNGTVDIGAYEVQSSAVGATMTTISSNYPNGSTYGDVVTFSATVRANSDGATPTGTVEFVIGGTDYGSIALVCGTASLSVSTVAAGSNSVMATYISDDLAAFQDSKATAPFTVSPYALTYQIGNDSHAYGSAAGLAADLGTLSGGAWSYVTGINDNGEVAGFADTAGGSGNAFLYCNGTMIDLGPAALARGGYFPVTLNDNGQVAYTAAAADGNRHAFVYSNGAVTGLDTLPGGTWSSAININDSGEVAGLADTASGSVHAYLYCNGTMTDLGPAAVARGGYLPVSVSSSGQVAYTGADADENPHAFMYDNGVVTDLGTLSGGTWSYPTSMNNSGEVGFADTASGSVHAFLYCNGTMTDVGPMDVNHGFSVFINDSGQVAYAGATADGNSHAFVYSSGVVTDLGTLPGGTWSVATGINDSGEVVGLADTAGGSVEAFRYSNGRMTDLGPAALSHAQYPVVVNDSGQVAYTVSAPDGNPHAVLCSNNRAIELPATIDTGINGETLTIAYSSTGDMATASVGDV